jgi:hypothetical protein
LPVPQNISTADIAKLPPQRCEECAKAGHDAVAVERVDGVYLCVYCRDGDPCPGCKAAKAAQAPKNGNGRKVALKDIVEAYQGADRKFSKVNGIEVRYPGEDEINSRFRRRSRNEMLADVLKVVQGSPTGHTELPIPKGMKGHSFQSLLARFVRSKKLRYTVHLDSPRGTVVVSNAQIHRAL